MTTYNYLTSMQEFCFRAFMALLVTKDDGMKDFYTAAEEGFSHRLSTIPVEEASKPINQSQLESYLRTKDFVEDTERKAAEILREEQESKNERAS